MEYVVLFVLGVGFIRLSIWSRRRRSRLYTAGLLAIGLSYAFALPWIGDDYLDKVVPDSLGQNASDLMFTVLTAVATGLIGAVFVRSLSGKARYQIAWTALFTLLVVVMVVANRVSDGSRVPVRNFFELSDAGTVVHLSAYLVAILAVVVTAGVLLVKLARNRQFDRDPTLWAFAPIPFCGVAYVGIVWWKMRTDPAWLAEHHQLLLMVTGAPALCLLAAAGLAGLWSGRQRPPRFSPTNTPR